MIFNSFQREDDDAVFTVVRNVSGAARAVGDAVVWDISGSVDGVRVTVPATQTLSLFRGILVEALADSAYGKVQVHGYNAAAFVIQDLTTDITAGNVLITANGSDNLKRRATAVGTGDDGLIYSAESFVTSTTPAGALKKVLIRAL